MSDTTTQEYIESVANMMNTVGYQNTTCSHKNRVEKISKVALIHN
jgi:hypothetical protein